MATTKVDAAALAAAVADAASVIRKAITLPVLGCVRLDAEGDVLRITGTDIDRFVSVSVPAFFADLFTAVVPAATLGEILRTLDGEVELAMDGDELRIECGSFTGVLASMAADEWPTPREGKAVSTFTLGGGALANASAWVAPCASTELSRPSIIGVGMNIDADESTVTFAATDGHRGARIRQCCGASESARLHVPVDGIATLAKLFGDAEDVALTLTEGHLTAEANGVRASVRLAADPFIGDEVLNRIFGVEATATLEIEPDEWRTAVRRVQATSRESTTGVALSVRAGGRHELRAVRDEVGRTRQEVLGALVDGEPIEIGLNARNVLHALAALKSHDRVRVRLRDASPIVIETEDQRLQYLTMPLRSVEGLAWPKKRERAA